MIPAGFLLGAVASAGILSVAALLAAGRRARLREARIALLRAGLRSQPDGRFREFSGRLAGLEASVKLSPRSALIELRGGATFPRDLRLTLSSDRLHDIWSRARFDLVAEGGAPLGAALCGDEATALAALESGTRALLERAVRRFEARIGNGRILAALPLARVAELGDCLADLAALGARLSIAPAELPARLAAAADQIPDVALRRLALAVLQERFPHHDETLAASRRAAAGPSRRMRLQGAMFLGPLGEEVVAQLALERETGAALRAESLDWLLARGSDRGREVAAALVADPDNAIQHAAIAAAVRLGDHAVARHLERIAASEDDATAAQIAGALERLGDIRSTAALVGILGRDDEPARRAAIAGLAAVGGLEAIEPLLALAGSREVVQPARRAVQSIQARAGNPDRGRLSMREIPGDEGALSPAESQAGALSPPVRANS